MSNHRPWHEVKRSRPEPPAAKRTSIEQQLDSDDLAYMLQVEHDPEIHQDGDDEV